MNPAQTTKRDRKPPLSMAELRALQKRRALQETSDSKRKKPNTTEAFLPTSIPPPALNRVKSFSHAPPSVPIPLNPEHADRTGSQSVVNRSTGTTAGPTSRRFTKSASFSHAETFSDPAGRNPFGSQEVICAISSSDFDDNSLPVPSPPRNPFSFLRSLSCTQNGDPNAGTAESPKGENVDAYASEEDDSGDEEDECEVADDYDVDDNIGYWIGRQQTPPASDLSVENQDDVCSSEILGTSSNSQNNNANSGATIPSNEPMESSRLFTALEAQSKSGALKSRRFTSSKPSTLDKFIASADKPNMSIPSRTDEEIFRELPDDEERGMFDDERVSPNIPTEPTDALPNHRRKLHMQFSSPMLPLDWTLPREVAIFSTVPFTWCTEINPYQETQALTAFVINETSPFEGASNSPDQHAHEFHRSLHVWQFPLSQPSPAQAAAVSRALTKREDSERRGGHGGGSGEGDVSDFAELEFFLQREIQWRKSFRSLYYGMRSGAAGTDDTAYFYVLADAFCVLFRSKCAPRRNGGGDGTESGTFIEAVLTRSTRGLRKRLEEEDIPFTMPLKTTSAIDSGNKKSEALSAVHRASSIQTCDSLPAGNVLQTGLEKSREKFSEADFSGDPEDEDWSQQALQELEKDGINVMIRNKDPKLDNGPRSVLHFTGHRGVHGLFDFLLNWKEPKVDLRARFIPVLVAPKPFLNGSVKKAELTKSGPIKHTVRDPVTNRTVMRTQYRLEITGTILPTCMVDIWDILAKKHSGNHDSIDIADEDGVLYHVRKKVQPETVGCNVGDMDIASGTGVRRAAALAAADNPELRKSWVETMRFTKGLGHSDSSTPAFEWDVAKIGERNGTSTVTRR